MAKEVYKKHFEDSEGKIFGSVVIRMDFGRGFFDFILWGSRVPFFENISKEGEKPFYSEGEKWEKIVEMMKKDYGLDKGLGGIFYKEGVIGSEEITKLVALSESYIENAFRYKRGFFIKDDAKTFIEKVREDYEKLQEEMTEVTDDEGLIPGLRKYGFHSPSAV